MQLLKLVYIAHGWHLATVGKPLICEPVQVWKYGPVVPSLFHEFKVFGGGPIKRLAHSADTGEWDLCGDQSEPELVVRRPFVPPEDATAHAILDWVWKTYGSKPAWQLSWLTHETGTPWSDAVKEMKDKHPDCEWVPGYEIDNEAIRKHYLVLWKTKHGGTSQQR